MTKQLTHVGFDNWINTAEIDAIQPYGSNPSVKLVQAAERRDSLFNATQGNRAKSVVILKSGHIVLSALTPETIAGRVENE